MRSSRLAKKQEQEARSKKQEARSKKQEARSKKQEARSKKQEGEETTPLHFQSIAHPGACGKTRVMMQNRRPGLKFTETGLMT
jgi:hypothetical protein